MAWIDKLVGRSPVGPMQEHMTAAVVCARQIVPLVEAMIAGDNAAIAAQRIEIDRLENAADD
ncbi:MAG: TIGR00153 family protein, partial [bacterium]